MKVTVKDYLNVRVGKPSVNAPTYQYIAPGSELEVDGKLYEGDTFEGSNLWMRDEAGNYYWAGGIKDKIINKINYNKIINTVINGNNNYTGKGIKVAVIDTGISHQHPALKGSIKFNIDYSGHNNADDKDGHGTHISGIIAAQSEEMTGIAPKTNIYNIKCANHGSGIYFSNLVAAIDEAIKQEVHIINLSLGIFLNAGDTIKMKAKIDEVYKKNIIVIAAAGENEFLSSQEGEMYPAGAPNCISVGAINSKFATDNVKFKDSLDYIFPFYDIMSCDLSMSVRNDKGSSMSCAVLTGWVALIKESNPDLTVEQIKNTIDTYAKTITNIIPNSDLLIPIKIR